MDELNRVLHEEQIKRLQDWMGELEVGDRRIAALEDIVDTMTLRRIVGL